MKLGDGTVFEGGGAAVPAIQYTVSQLRGGANVTTVSVIVAAYTMKRWKLLSECMDSVLAQTHPIEQIVLCIDNNEELYQLAHRTWHDTGRAVVLRNPHNSLDEKADAHARAHGSRRRFGAGTARNAGVAVTTSDVVAIIDDDARADADWLENLLRPYADGSVVAVGGPPLADYESGRPTWFPRSFDWVFGCEYAGLPTKTGPLRHLIGANMSIRRSAFDKVGGFHSIDFDDLDMCMRLGHAFGHGALMYVPGARVHHHVPAERTTWDYFWRRCFFVNVEKVEAFHDMAEAANLTAEVAFALRTLTFGVAAELRRVPRGERAGLRGAAAIVAGLALAAAGNLWGRVRVRSSTRARR